MSSERRAIGADEIFAKDKCNIVTERDLQEAAGRLEIYITEISNREAVQGLGTLLGTPAERLSTIELPPS